MPINVPDALPAARLLEDEHIFIMTHSRAEHQDIRPLKILIMNIMPKKIETEVQLLRLLSNNPIQLDITFLHPVTHESKNTESDYLKTFYRTFEEIKDEKFDGMIITGAPIEHLDFEDVTYWHELTKIMDWTRHNVFSTFHICWGAMAGLYYHYGIAKEPLIEKLSGVYRHEVLSKTEPLFRGFDDQFYAPHSRHTTLNTKQIETHSELSIGANSDIAGTYIVTANHGRQIFVTGHSEYDPLTLDSEYKRDVLAGLNPKIPQNYYPNDNPSNEPSVRWRSHAHLLFSNWLNYYVYQETPFDPQHSDIDY